MRKDQNYIRIQNTKMFLDIITEKRPISRADIAKEAGMSPTSITRAVSFLIELGLIRETGIYSTGVGRRAVMLDLVPDSVFTVGLHISTDFIKLCIVNFEYTDVVSCKIALDVTNLPPEEVAEEAYHVFMRLVEENNIDVSKFIGMGICLAGAVQNQTGLVLSSPQLGWTDVDLSRIFRERFQIPVLIENVIKAGVVGEKHAHHIPAPVDATLIVIDSEVSAASTSNGMLIRGKRNAAGYLGHTIVEPKGKKCACGRSGCLQTFLSENYLLQYAQESDKNIRTLSDIITAEQKNVSWAVKLVEQFREKMLLCLDIVVNAYNPAIIFLDGSVVHAFQPTIQLLSEQFLRSSHHPIPVDSLIISDSQEDSCMVGSAILAFQEFIYLLLSRATTVPYGVSTPLYYLG